MVLKDKHHYLDDISKAAALIRKHNTVAEFKENFNQIISLIAKIPGHEEMVGVNDVHRLEDWQVNELRNSLLQNLAKSKSTTQRLLRTVD